ncbi:MAG: hypothetical protein NC048_05415 [Bacteroides sp.]|nr:hypothetical protein [Ruminococcus flavefaciens]MCM1554916.1 hypothetical protein [Bacteroides sp.]
MPLRSRMLSIGKIKGELKSETVLKSFEVLPGENQTGFQDAIRGKSVANINSLREKTKNDFWDNGINGK